MDLEKIATQLDAAAASLTKMADDLRAVPPVPEPPPPPESVVERLTPNRRIEDFEWPVEPERIAEADGVVVVRQGPIAEGRFALFGFPAPQGQLIPGAIQKFRITTRVSAPGDARIGLRLYQAGQPTEIAKTIILSTDFSAYVLPWSWVADDLGINVEEVQCRVEFLTNCPGRYEVDALEWLAVHDGVPPTDGGESS